MKPPETELIFETPKESPKFRILLGTQEQEVVISLHGIIDEDSKFEGLIERIKKLLPSLRHISFNLGNVNRINSCGIREWLLMIKVIQPLLPLKFYEVSEPIIEQVNMIAGFFGSEKDSKSMPVVNFYAPYRCNQCRIETSVLLRPEEVPFAGEACSAPVRNCGKCKSVLEFQSLEDEYFHFLTRSKN
jgi:hypothetical protein